ncbi:unnamed protein product [Rhizophagus irregularis]|nr:unnamed protein product [Rhizophagus irregularis]
MKNFISILALILTFNNFVFVSGSLLEWRRDELLGIRTLPASNSTLAERAICPGGFIDCLNGGCCPRGSKCIADNKCSIRCTPGAPLCNGGCCLFGQVCGGKFCVAGTKPKAPKPPPPAEKKAPPPPPKEKKAPPPPPKEEKAPPPPPKEVKAPPPPPKEVKAPSPLPKEPQPKKQDLPSAPPPPPLPSFSPAPPPPSSPPSPPKSPSSTKAPIKTPNSSVAGSLASSGSTFGSAFGSTLVYSTVLVYLNLI